MKKEIRQVEIFIASDGREFDKEKNCIYYEKELGYTFSTSFLIGNMISILPFVMLIIPLYKKEEYWIVLGIILFSGIISLLSIITLIVRKCKN
jgi:hypothetical protein